MLAVGSVLIGFMVLALGILTPAFRDPDGRRWINRPLVGELVTVVLVGVLTLGLGFIGAGIMSEYAHGLDPIDIGLLLAVAVGTVVLWRRLNLGHRVDVVEERSATASVSHLMGQGRGRAATCPSNVNAVAGAGTLRARGPLGPGDPGAAPGSAGPGA